MFNQVAGDRDIADTRTEFQNQLLKVGGMRSGIFVYLIIIEHDYGSIILPLVHPRGHFITDFKRRKVSQLTQGS